MQVEGNFIVYVEGSNLSIAYYYDKILIQNNNEKNINV